MLSSLCSGIKLHAGKINFFFLVAQYTICIKLRNQNLDSEIHTRAYSLLSFIFVCLKIVDAKNVLVVVTRWFGGVQIGPDRFRHINNAARQVLIAGNLIPESKSHKK